MNNYTIKPIAIVFDFDGVIIDSLNLHVLAWQKATQELCNKTFELQEIYAQLDKSPELIAKYLAQNDENIAQKIVQRKKNILLDYKNIVMPIFPGVWESFRFLQDHEIPFAIGSNAPKAFITNTLQSLGLEVPVVCGREDVQNAKPDPEIFILCAQKLAINPCDYDKILVFEDSIHGIIAAKRASMIPIGISTRHTIKELKDAGAVIVCAHLRDAYDQKLFENLSLDKSVLS